MAALPAPSFLWIPISILSFVPIAAQGADFPPLHATFGGGPVWLLAKDAETGAVPQFHAGLGVAIKPRVVLSFDVRRYEVADEPTGRVRTVLAVGPGVRRIAGNGKVRPFLQANFLHVRESLDGVDGDPSFFDDQSSGLALGLMGGADVALGRTFSAPVGISVLLGEADEDVSCLGVSAGVSFHPPFLESEPGAVDDAVPAEIGLRSRVQAGFGGAKTQSFGYTGDPYEDAIQGHGAFLWSASRGVGLSLGARVYRSEETDPSFDPLDPFSVERSLTISLGGFGARFMAGQGTVRSYFDLNAWAARVTEKQDVDAHDSHRTETTVDPGIGAGLGALVRVSRRVEVPLGLRYDHVFRQRDVGLLGIEAGVTFALGS